MLRLRHEDWVREKEESRVTPSTVFRHWVVDGGCLGKDGRGAGLAMGTPNSVWG